MYFIIFSAGWFLRSKSCYSYFLVSFQFLLSNLTTLSRCILDICGTQSTIREYLFPLEVNGSLSLSLLTSLFFINYVTLVTVGVILTCRLYVCCKKKKILLCFCSRYNHMLQIFFEFYSLFFSSSKCISWFVQLQN